MGSDKSLFGGRQARKRRFKNNGYHSRYKKGIATLSTRHNAQFYSCFSGRQNAVKEVFYRISYTT